MPLRGGEECVGGGGQVFIQLSWAGRHPPVYTAGWKNLIGRHVSTGYKVSVCALVTPHRAKTTVVAVVKQHGCDGYSQVTSRVDVVAVGFFPPAPVTFSETQSAPEECLWRTQDCDSFQLRSTEM